MAATFRSNQDQPQSQHRHVESWDDDNELEGVLFSNSHSTVKTSLSSRLSIRSESNTADDDWQVPIATNDQQSTSMAIDSAKKAGIPIPENVPASALVGGTIKRLGGKKPRQAAADDWDNDLVFADVDLHPLQLKRVKIEQPTDESLKDAFEDWTEESSLGVRNGKSKADGKHRASSISVASSSMTLESEEDGLNGIVLPPGLIDLHDSLNKRRRLEEDHSPTAQNESNLSANQGEEQTPKPPAATHTRVASDQDDFLDGLNIEGVDVFDSRKRTINRNIKQNWKPSQTANVSAPKTQTSLTFLDREKSTKIPRPVPSSRPGRLEPVFESGATTITRPRYAAATMSSAQLLKAKRSMPVLGRHDPLIMSRAMPPQSTVAQARAPFRTFLAQRYQSSQDLDTHRPASPSRPSSRLSGSFMPETPTRSRKDTAPASLAREAASKRTVTRPSRRRNFGDGTELDLFDDLPTSAAKEQKFMKPATVKTQTKTLRSTQSQSRLGLRDKMVTPLPSALPRSPSKADLLPRFARDTAASRIAREQKLGTVSSLGSKPRDVNVAPRINWPAHVAARSPNASPSAHRTLRKGPTLINPMGKENTKHFLDDASKKGMQWNATLFRWEGNDLALASFDPPAPPSPPRPALITNLAATQGVQVVGGMVFDPQRMCWLKMGVGARSASQTPSVEEDDDPFKDIPDLKDDSQSAGRTSAAADGFGSGELMREEFDLGPAFIARQRDEEAVWRSRVNGWFDNRPDEADAWKYAIREIAGLAQQY